MSVRGVNAMQPPLGDRIVQRGLPREVAVDIRIAHAACDRPRRRLVEFSHEVRGLPAFGGWGSLRIHRACSANNIRRFQPGSVGKEPSRMSRRRSSHLPAVANTRGIQRIREKNRHASVGIATLRVTALGAGEKREKLPFYKVARSARE